MKVLSGLDLNGNQITNVDAIIDGTENDIVKIGSNGELVDSGVSISDIEPNVIESVSVNGTALTPTNKNVDIDLSDYVETTDERIIPTVTMNLSYDFDASEDVSGNRISNTSYSFPNDEVPNVQFAKLTLNMTCNVKLNGSVVMTSETTQNGWFNKHDILNTVSGEEETINVIHITAPFFYGEAVVECEAVIAYQTLIIFEPNYWVNDAVQAGLADFAEQLPPVATSGDYDDLSNKPELATVATSGDYDDLDNKPDLSGYAETANLATVATSGDYDDLQNKPDLSDFVSANDLSSVATSGSYNDLQDTPEFATVATSGDYDDLQNKPDLSSFFTESDLYSVGLVFSSQLASVATSGDYDDLQNKPDLSEYVTSSDLATVATSGDYDDLENKPDLSDYLTSEDLENVSHVFETEITDSNVSGSDANTFNIFYIQSDYPVVQVVYDNKVVHDGIEITYGVGDITVEWDSTKYTVDSNNPLHVTVIG